MSHRVRQDCRLCGAGDLETVLELAPTPPANEFVRASDPPQECFPLYLARCRDCGHVQLPVVVDPERLFRDYVYVSGTSQSFVDHFRAYARDVCGDLSKDALIVEIGSNDGTLLQAFKDLGFSNLQGIDPAREIAAQATGNGIDTIPYFFDRAIAQDVIWRRGQKAALVLANNVFAHADDLREIALGVRDMLSGGGKFVFEVQYLVDMVEKTLFDMVYHEHLSYHTLGPLVRFFDSLGMTLYDAQKVPTHGGSIRCFVQAGKKIRAQTQRLESIMAWEVGALVAAHDPWGKFRRRIDDAGEKIRDFLTAERQAGRCVAGYGAPAKLTTLCHQFGITAKDIAFVVDDSPWKQGKLTPGTRIITVSFDDAGSANFISGTPDAFVIFAWNFAEPIAKKLRSAGYNGKIVTPLPTFLEI